MDNQTTKRLLIALAHALPDEGSSHLTGFNLHTGWGDILNVRLHTAMQRTSVGMEFGTELRQAVSEVLGQQRHAVEIVWDSPPRRNDWPSL